MERECRLSPEIEMCYDTEMYTLEFLCIFNYLRQISSYKRDPNVNESIIFNLYSFPE